MDQLGTKTDYEFGGFRLDTVMQVLVSPAGELIALPGRAYDVLRYLLERPGELVDKASLMRAVWPSTVVEDNNLNQCILVLRRALGESAGDRRFILTVPGRGFKLVAPVRAIPVTEDTSPADSLPPGSASRSPPPPAPPPIATSPERPLDRPVRGRLLVIGSALVAIAILAGVSAFFAQQGSSVTQPTEYQALTDLSESATAPTISADGKMLAFIVGDPRFLGAGRIYVKSLPDGEPEPLTKVLGSIYGPAFSPDDSQVAFTYFNNGRTDPAWNTLTVPTAGGRPTLLLGNSAGLTWIAPHRLLYSEIGSGIHMGLVTSTDERTDRRQVYFPSHERGMAHYSYLSPDRRAVLVVEMDRTGAWRRCRVVPFDGSSPGSQVGPTGSCTSAAWSPDSRWMYFSATVAGHSHLWRQRYPDGKPQQITFGPTEDVGVAVMPNGRSLVTSLGLQRQSVWLHDRTGEHPVTSDAIAFAPWLSTDAKRLYFLVASASAAPATLWRLDLEQGQEAPVLPGLNILSYDISPDEREVVFSAEHRGEMQIWIAPLDHHLPPRLIAHGADQPAFGGGWVFFRRLGEKENHLYRMQADGSAEQRILDFPILQFQSVSPNGKWAAVLAVMDGQVATAILGVGKGTFRWVRAGYWASRWAPDGRDLYLQTQGSFRSAPDETLVVDLAGSAAPRIPQGMTAGSSLNILPHGTEGFAPGPDPDTYAFTRTDWLRNIYRIPLHQ